MILILIQIMFLIMKKTFRSECIIKIDTRMTVKFIISICKINTILNSSTNINAF